MKGALRVWSRTTNGGNCTLTTRLQSRTRRQSMCKYSESVFSSMWSVGVQYAAGSTPPLLDRVCQAFLSYLNVAPVCRCRAVRPARLRCFSAAALRCDPLWVAPLRGIGRGRTSCCLTGCLVAVENWMRIWSDLAGVAPLHRRRARPVHSG
jgi:hypothetical protein